MSQSPPHTNEGVNNGAGDMDHTRDTANVTSKSSKTRNEASQTPPAAADDPPEWFKYKDGKRAWAVVLAAFIVQVIIVGILHIFGVFYVHLVTDFNASKADAAWVGSAAYGISMAFGPVCGFLLSHFGNQVVSMTGTVICTVSLLVSSFAPSIGVLYASFSILYGVGTSLAYTPTMCFGGIYFERYQTVATGIMVAGSSTGTLVLAPIAQKLITHYGWRGAFRIFAGAAFVCTLSAYMFKPLPGMPTKAEVPPNSLNKKWSPLRDRVFMVYTAAVMLVQFGYYIPYVHLMSFAEDLGIPPEKASLLMMFLGGTTAFSRVSFGKIIGMLKMNRLHLHQLSMVITGTATMLLPLVTSFSGLVIFVVSIGLIDGCYVVLLPTNTAMLMGPSNVVTAWGYLIGFASITFTVGPPCAGWMYDATGSYDIAFHMAGVPVVWGAMLIFFIPLAQRYSKVPSAVEYIEMQAERRLPSPSAFSSESVETVKSRDSFEHVQRDDVTDQADVDVEVGSVSDKVTQTIEILKRTSHSIIELEKQLPENNAGSRSSNHSSLKSPISPSNGTSGRTSSEEFGNVTLTPSEMERSFQRQGIPIKGRTDNDVIKSPDLSITSSTRHSSTGSLPIALGFPGIPPVLISPGNSGNTSWMGPSNNYDDMEFHAATSPVTIASPLTMNGQPLVVSPTSTHFSTMSNVSLAPVVEEVASSEGTLEPDTVQDSPGARASSPREEPVFNMSDLSLTS